MTAQMRILQLKMLDEAIKQLKEQRSNNAGLEFVIPINRAVAGSDAITLRYVGPDWELWNNRVENHATEQQLRELRDVLNVLFEEDNHDRADY